jgi:hypothetical protein
MMLIADVSAVAVACVVPAAVTLSDRDPDMEYAVNADNPLDMSSLAIISISLKYPALRAAVGSKPRSRIS